MTWRQQQPAQQMAMPANLHARQQQHSLLYDGIGLPGHGWLASGVCEGLLKHSHFSLTGMCSACDKQLYKQMVHTCRRCRCRK